MTHLLETLRRVSELPADERRWFIEGLERRHRQAMGYVWRFWAHDGQLPPEGEWRVWLMLAGRGFGKTRAGAEWVSALARERPAARIALVGATPAEVEKVMIRGRERTVRGGAGRKRIWSSIRAAGGSTSRAARRRFVYSGANPDGLRGPEHDFAWCDELAKWAYPEATLGQSDDGAPGQRRGAGADHDDAAADRAAAQAGRRPPCREIARADDGQSGAAGRLQGDECWRIMAARASAGRSWTGS